MPERGANPALVPYARISLNFGTLRVAWKVSNEFPSILRMVIATPLDLAVSSPSLDCFKGIPSPPVYKRQDKPDFAADEGDVASIKASNTSGIILFIDDVPV